MSIGVIKKMDKKIFVFGFGKSSRRLLDQLDIDELKKITGFIDNDATKWGNKYHDIECLSPYSMKCEHESIEVIFPISDAFLYSDIYVEHNKLLNLCKNLTICVCPTEFYSKKKKKIEDIEKYILGENTLINLSYFVRNDCNLKCLSCVACSPLVKQPQITSIDVFERDIKRLYSFFPHIEEFSLQGGEILLDEKLLCDYIKTFRKYYKYTKMNILSNGLRVLNLKGETINILKNNKVQLRISFYPLLKDKINKIVDFLNENNIDFKVYRSFEFWKLLTLKKRDGSLKSLHCLKSTGDTCFSISNGKLYRCQLPRSNKILNARFNSNLPTDGEIDLYSDSITSADIWKKLNLQIGSCSYCRMLEPMYEFPHTLVKNPDELDISDWLGNE